jgi:hypothetical protein
MTTLEYVTPSAEDARPRSLFTRASLQLAHRSLSIALILFVIGAGACAAGKTAAPLLLWAFAAGDVALLGAFVSLVADRRRALPGRESLVAAYLAASVALVSLVLFFIFRLRGG